MYQASSILPAVVLKMVVVVLASTRRVAVVKLAMYMSGWLYRSWYLFVDRVEKRRFFVTLKDQAPLLQVAPNGSCSLQIGRPSKALALTVDAHRFGI